MHIKIRTYILKYRGPFSEHLIFVRKNRFYKHTNPTALHPETFGPVFRLSNDVQVRVLKKILTLRVLILFFKETFNDDILLNGCFSEVADKKMYFITLYGDLVHCFNV